MGRVAVYESSTCLQNSSHFTKAVNVHKTSGTCLRKQYLFTKRPHIYESDACLQNSSHFTKAVNVHKTSGSCLRKKCLFTKKNGDFRKQICLVGSCLGKRCSFWKATACLRKQHLFTKQPPLYESRECPQNKRQLFRKEMFV